MVRTPLAAMAVVVVVVAAVLGPATAAPSPVAEAAAVPEPCCGRGAAGALGFVGVSYLRGKQN